MAITMATQLTTTREERCEADLPLVRRKLIHVEAEYSNDYFQQIFQLFPEKVRPSNRKGFMAYDGLNNTFNLAYEILSWKVHRALIKAKLEPFLGFVHSLVHERFSLVCDFQELYRYLIDDFLIQYCRKLSKKDFTAKFVSAGTGNKRKGKREFLNNLRTKNMLEYLEQYFAWKVPVPRIRRGFRQEFETLINEEAILLAMYLRNERQNWIPRIADLE
jgi:CRISPR-associated protein Cas1